jgi:potassium-transporting ATPase KdpC subunit
MSSASKQKNVPGSLPAAEASAARARNSVAAPPAPPLSSLAGKALGMLAAMTLITGVAYPLLVTGVANAAFPEQSTGSLVVKDGKVLGSRLIGQPFSEPKYFWGRVSATTPMAYNAGASAGSNLGPTNEALTKAARDRVEALRAADPGNEAPVPVDLVTSTGSGLDPHITPAAAEYQVRRIARLRGVPEDRVRQLVSAHTEGRDLGVLGEPRVNVLLLNVALDELDRTGPARAHER